MNLEQYAAQQTQGQQEEPQAQEVLTVEQLAAKLDAEKLSSLTAQLQEAIDEQMAPAAILEQITGTLFGTSSPQAAAVAEIIEADRHPGGRELAIAEIRQQRKLLKKQQKQLQEQEQAVAAEIARLDAAERALIRAGMDAAPLDSGLMDVLTFCKTLDPRQPDLLQQLESLHKRHHENPAAMGLLYGCITELAWQQYSTGGLDLAQQAEFNKLKEAVAAIIA